MVPLRTSDAKDKSVLPTTLVYIQSKRWKFRFCLNAIRLSTRALSYAEIAKGFLFRADLESYQLVE